MTDNSEWHVVTEQRGSHSATLNREYEVVGIKRDDGFTVFREGMSREKSEDFLCRGDFGEFKFTATRWDDFKNKELDIYIVKFFSGYIEKNKEKIMRAKSSDIEAALLRFPVSRHFSAPVKDVVFQMEIGYSSATVKHANEIQTR